MKQEVSAWFYGEYLANSVTNCCRNVIHAKENSKQENFTGPKSPVDLAFEELLGLPFTSPPNLTSDQRRGTFGDLDRRILCEAIKEWENSHEGTPMPWGLVFWAMMEWGGYPLRFIVFEYAYHALNPKQEWADSFALASWEPN